MSEALPFSAPLDLGSVAQTRTETLIPGPDVRKRIAEWAGLDALDALKAVITVSRAGDDFYSLEAQLSADAVQSCVVTLEPVRSRIDREFSRRYQVMRRRRGKPDISGEPAAEAVFGVEDENEVEIVDHPVIDMAAPVLEELSLAIDPYPRAPGAVFDLPGEEEQGGESPFAVLKQLKTPAREGRGKPRKS